MFQKGRVRIVRPVGDSAAIRVERLIARRRARIRNSIMRLRIHHSLAVISLVSVYAPTEASDLTVKDAFHAMLESVVDQ